MRTSRFEVVAGEPSLFCPVRARRVPLDLCSECPWFVDIGVSEDRMWLRCSPPGYWPLQLPVDPEPDVVRPG